MVDLPQPDRGRARHRARAGDDRFLEVVGDRGRPEVRAGQAGRQFDLAEGRRGGLHRACQDRAPLRRRRGGDGVRREGPGRHARAQDRDLRSAPTTSWSTRSASRREDIIFDPNIFAVATGIEEHNGYGVAFIEATRWIRQEPAARAYLRRRVEPVVLVPRQRAGARGDALGVPLSRHQGRHGHGHRQCRPDGGLRRSRSGVARGLRGRGAQPPAGRDRAAAGARRAIPRRTASGEPRRPISPGASGRWRSG